MAPVDAVVTLSDVAREAGVSIATASKALNGKDDVAAETRRRVLAIAEAMSFRANPMAKGLNTRLSGTVGLLTGDLEGRFMIPILTGAENAFVNGRVDVFLCDARGDAIREQHQLRALLNRRVDGIIVVGASTNPRSSLAHDIPVPVVYVNAPSENPDDLSLAPDEFMGGRIAVEHLLACGRTRIAHISGDPAYTAAHGRAAGARAALRDAGLDFVADPVFSEWSEQWGRSATAMLLGRHPDVDGIFAGSDQIARGVLDTARELGREVPDDLSVIGYDNWEVIATGSRPGLTTVDAQLQDLGRLAAQRIFEGIDGADIGAGVRQQPVRLVVRGSTVPGRAPAGRG
ncbi:LacI family transcriptional regulator [Herbiconiux moechotypicola]|uniref:LacI family DNA-binding transcriptional regulator n=1 Tax=Herbiconiux moechotypicola TaxID=637393 RepID=A0ABP5QWI5_9MICO|nr:LacI family DNA-binding transcriptional regulator [Herbiconiux moechotypicola]MCS5730787.1 LacI family transcriptional regulator [Herbiconiux moechotypicola]